MPLFTVFIIFVFVIRHAIRKNDARRDADNAAFFKKEHDANFVRKKSLDDLSYIRIREEDLPFGALPEDPEALEAERLIRGLIGEPIVNLTGISNTDLKLAYGTANITVLTQYDTNYMTLARALQKWSRALFQSGRYQEAARVLAFAIDTRTDISQSWHLYIECLRFHLGLAPEESRQKMISLLPVAQSLNSLSRDGIVRELEEAIGDL
ncbi:MAG: hypothetical protein K6B72_03865 [Lachnospiraceae bacterium]|nr:hypothetical protein [Lachnospiraceae bacterium]